MHSAHIASLVAGFCLITGSVAVAAADPQVTWTDWDAYFRLGLDKRFVWECPLIYYHEQMKAVRDRNGPCVSYQITEEPSCIEPRKYGNQQRSFYFDRNVVCDLFNKPGCPKRKPDVENWANPCDDSNTCGDWVDHQLDVGPRSMYCAIRPLGWWKGKTRAPP